MTNALQAYRQELATIKRLSADEKEALLLVAREGDAQAKEQLILSLTNTIFAKALLSSPLDDDLAMELASIGNATLVFNFDRLILRDYPLARLTASAYGAMQHYALRGRGLITLPSGPNVFSIERCSLIDALDVPLPIQQQGRDTEVLYRALDVLTEETRLLIIRLFGLYGEPQLSVKDIAGGGTNDPAYQALKTRRLTALKKLREKLQDTYQQSNAGKTIPDYACLELPDWCKARLDAAMCTLQERGEAISMNKLRQEARVHTRYASAYLWQIRRT